MGPKVQYFRGGVWGGGPKVQYFLKIFFENFFGNFFFFFLKQNGDTKSGGAGGTPLAVTQEDCLVIEDFVRKTTNR